MASERRVAIVTGGGSGIGAACAKAIAARNFAVVVADLDAHGGADVVASIVADGGTATFLASDVSDPGANEALVTEALDSFGRLDAAVNNAGILGDMLPLGEYSDEQWREVMRVNLDGVFYGIRAQLPPMLERGRGSIVNMASVAGQVAYPGAPAYVASKHAVVGLTRQLAAEYAARGIRATAVGPGAVQTPMIDRPETQGVEQAHPIGRVGQPVEIAEVVAWLCADAPDFLNGAYIPVDGGYLTR